MQSNVKRGVSESSSDVFVSTGGEVVANDLIEGGLSQTPNVILPSGLIKTNDKVKAVGTATISEGEVIAQVSHGIDVQLFSEEVAVTPYDNLNGLSYWIKFVNSTTFSINISAPAPAGGVQFKWQAQKLI